MKGEYIPRYYLKNGREIGGNPHKKSQVHTWEAIPGELMCTETDEATGYRCMGPAVYICVPCGYGRCEKHAASLQGLP